MFESKAFGPVMQPQKPLRAVDLTGDGYPGKVIDQQWLVGGYLENRKGMYTSELYNNERYIHLGIDIWASAGNPVFAIRDGEVFGVEDNNSSLNYGPTLITQHEVSGIKIWCLYGHLSRGSIAELKAGDTIKKGDKLALLGSTAENGGWIPHLHFQVGLDKPTTIDMPGVCAPDEVSKCRLTYPDPRLLLGPLY
ncbi:MAG: peptidoglycan DD-metalloendopeptidase family protein [Balneolales bacterium]|nr:peptidoglycan DD-metalloendopeptidase family protein [Balneolales bacterium]